MIKSVLKNLFFIFGLVMFITGSTQMYNLNYSILMVLGMILITLGWKYPSEKQLKKKNLNKIVSIIQHPQKPSYPQGRSKL